MGIIMDTDGSIGLELRTESFIITDYTSEELEYGYLELDYDQLEDLEKAVKLAREKRRDKKG